MLTFVLKQHKGISLRDQRGSIFTNPKLDSSGGQDSTLHRMDQLRDSRPCSPSLKGRVDTPHSLHTPVHPMGYPFAQRRFLWKKIDHWGVRDRCHPGFLILVQDPLSDAGPKSHREGSVMYGDHCLEMSKTGVPWDVGFSVPKAGCPGQTRMVDHPSFQGLL